MKLVRFVTAAAEAAPRLGALVQHDAAIVDLRRARVQQLVRDGALTERAESIAAAMFADTIALIESGRQGLDVAQELLADAPAGATLAAADAQLLAPLIPTRLRDFIAFETHMRNWLVNRNGLEMPPEYYEVPVFYKGNPRTVVGPDADVPWPPYSQEWDYELELGVVLGSSAQDIPRAEAESHIFGITCFNDFSARDIQRTEVAVGLGPAKAKDFATGLGPCLLTIDEVPDLYDIDMRARVNGETWSTGNTSEIHWRFDAMIERMSASEPLVPGEILGSGTVGNGCGLELGRLLQDGDVVELEVGEVGVLRNRVVRPPGSSG